MKGKAPAKMDARAAWNAWTADGCPTAGAEFLQRVESWTDGTAAQLTRGAARNAGPRLTRDEIVDRLRYHLGVIAGGEPLKYVEALERARREVIEELRPRPRG
ncbi:MAG: hypothetical protein ACRDY7_08915 [Acidimicrobiia bacterium]